ncbi:MAG: 2-oxo acid dehydrogenase subunit E2 [Candidatus Woesearchaeota archaeon]|nr:MAG: 2-oxo acid dehydrogenase subunit E2 [Candidatus Woesearchaeota archaeon]
MKYEFKFPDIGEGITEGEVVKWKVKEGDYVKVDQTLGEIETDKAVVEMPSPKEGKILKLHIKEGGTIKVGETLVTLEIKEEQKSVSVMGELEEAKEVTKETPIKKQPAAQITHVKATPAIRKLAKELNINLENIKGTGPDQRITEKDLKSALGTPKITAETTEKPAIKITKKYDMWGYIDRIPLKGTRKAISQHMVEAQSNAVHVTHIDEADVTHLVEIREKEKEELANKNIHLTFLPFVIKACVAALKKYPYFNSELDNDEIIIKKYYNIGIAVDSEDGLKVPVIKGADKKDIRTLAREIQDLAEKVRIKKIDLMDLKGGTFTITNVGSIGGLYATPIVNYPEVSILALGRIYDKLVPDKKKGIKRIKVMPLSLSFDHRVVDGAQAALFVNEIKKHLEDPDMFLVE